MTKNVASVNSGCQSTKEMERYWFLTGITFANHERDTHLFYKTRFFPKCCDISKDPNTLFQTVLIGGNYILAQIWK